MLYGDSQYDREETVVPNVTFVLSVFPIQIETYVEADWSPRYAANSGLLTKIKGFKMQDRDSIWPEHTSLK